ncbi:bile acid:sodium symporter family protein [Hahella ganghwensis]|uniref:bile acid:sodium symporter family protein n=1 Tax=Hahella ganghwensis TaxID=286420 RepID=UPI0003787C25|nr:bile acid:sodium symporter family protein [Hahella ganghwensis]
MTDGLLFRIGVPLGLFIIMFGLGATLSRSELREAIKDRVAMIVGLLAQVVLLPVIGLIIAWLAPVSVEIKYGILILACCPGGTTSNIFTYLARGNLALSVSLTTISSLLSLLTMPLTLALGSMLLAEQSSSLDIPQGYIIKSLLAVTVVPVCLGMFIRHKWSKLADWLESRITIFSSLFLATLVLAIGIKDWDVLIGNMPTLGPVMVLLSAASMLMGAFAARVARVGRADVVTIGLEAGIQNSGLAIFMALSVLQSELMSIPAAIYSVSMYVCATIAISIGRKQFQRELIQVTSSR